MSWSANSNEALLDHFARALGSPLTSAESTMLSVGTAIVSLAPMVLGDARTAAVQVTQDLVEQQRVDLYLIRRIDGSWRVVESHLVSVGS
jgi:translation initiation factor 2 gamma subunit (eIF-2gamma)